MKRRQTFWILAFLAIVIFAVWLLRDAIQETRPKPEQVANTVQPPDAKTQKADNALLTKQSSGVESESQSAPSAANIGSKYKQGLISKAEVIFQMQKRQYLQPQNFYGKITDQNGDPVVGVKVAAGNEALKSGTENEVVAQTFTAQSDSDGLFEITGKTGTPIGVRLSKSGYLWGLRGEGYKAPASGASSSTDRVTLIMWKLHGAEPLAISSVDAKIPFDGMPTKFDVATGKQSVGGDLQVTLVRSPLQVRRGKDLFDWTVRIELLGGGILPENDPYPYWAPADGYQPSFEFSMSSNNVPWTSSFQSNFYIKNARGQYGRMQANIYSALTPARIQVHFTVNPSGSQNLEPDLSK